MEYRRFFIQLVKFIIILIVFDIVIGLSMRHLFFSQTSGKYYRISYPLEKTTDSLIIFGSSRANRHYSPSILTKETGVSCYNAGMQGKNIVFTDAIQKVILTRHKPKMIILDINPHELLENPVQYDKLGDLIPYYFKYEELLRPYINKKSKYENIKLLSITYQYNSTILHILKYKFLPQKDDNGYLPVKGTNIKIGKEELKESKNQSVKNIDNYFAESLESFIKRSKDLKIPIILVVSPMYKSNLKNDDKSFNLIKKIANKYNVQILNYLNSPEFDNPELFFDALHLNNVGSKKFSEKFAQDLKNIFLIKDNITAE
ncbi:MAG: hypothetical protein A2X12_01375 [Bacteroidetes bacterium GWE2_29_8]|nr:MAG: hypothetical protein A2X12_01375 [Bacteroidetes bacterium GWE2_29_8]OFY23402.1 MAG: hypothetical protein A2X02_08860 [Bacteroidetes bacterium GWF2_29_10]